MAYDIGPKIGIDGEAEFRRQLQHINTSIKTLGSEMKAVTSEFIGQENSVEALAAQNDVLTKSIAAQKDKLQQQQQFLDRAKEKFGDNADETLKWQRAVNESTAELNKLEAQLRDNERRMDGFGDETDNVADSLDDAAKSGLSFGDVLKANVLSDFVVSGVQALAGVVMDLARELWNLDEATKEYRTEQGKLASAFETNGHGAEAADKAYTSLFKVIGDSGQATEASQLLANLAKNTQDLDKWARIAAGSTGRFGDALPITSLIEAANEAAKTGESVSALDDALNWIGIDAEAFGETLSATTTEEERLRIITDTLSEAYAEAADSFYSANEELMRTRENELLLIDAQAAVGEAISNLKNVLIEQFAPAVGEVATAFADMISGVEGADERFAAAITNLIETGAEKLPEFVEQGADMAFSIIEGLHSEPVREELTNSIISIISSLLGTIAENLPNFLTQGALLVLELAAGLVKGIPDALQKIPVVTKQILDEFLANKEAFAEVGKELGNALVDAMAGVLELLKGKPGSFIGGIDLTAPKPIPHKTGLSYVPYDGYLAELHKGEMVLTARQADMMRSTGVTQSSVQNMTAAVVNGMQSFAAPAGDTPAVINLITPDGDTLASWQLPSLIRVAAAAGTPITSTT